MCGKFRKNCMISWLLKDSKMTVACRTVATRLPSGVPSNPPPRFSDTGGSWEIDSHAIDSLSQAGSFAVEKPFPWQSPSHMGWIFAHHREESVKFPQAPDIFTTEARDRPMPMSSGGQIARHSLAHQSLMTSIWIFFLFAQLWTSLPPFRGFAT